MPTGGPPRKNGQALPIVVLVILLCVVLGSIIAIVSDDGGDGDEDETVANTSGGNRTTTTTRGGGSVTTTTTGSTTATTTAPEPPPLTDPDAEAEIAADPEDLATYANDCYDGDMGQCDELWYSTSIGGVLEAYAESCGGRAPEASHSGNCETSFG